MDKAYINGWPDELMPIAENIRDIAERIHEKDSAITEARIDSSNELMGGLLKAALNSNFSKGN
jgi:hypothetical protein